MSSVLVYFVGLFLLSSTTIYLIDKKYFENRIPVINIDKLKVVNEVSDKFLSIALDSSLIRNGLIRRIKWVSGNGKWKFCILNEFNCFTFSFREKDFFQKSSFLAPAYLRIGGTGADRLIFVEQESENNNMHESAFSEEKLFDESNGNIDNFTMTGNVWSSLNEFSRRCHFHLVFDFNVLLRNQNKWDSSNAQDLLIYSSHFNNDIVWQLGNEPNSFRHVFGTAISPAQLGNDFKDLRKLLNKFSQGRKCVIVGPDITRPKHLGENPINYLKDFLLSVGNSTINAVTWHQYYLNGRTAILQDFINPDTFNILRKEITAIKNVVDKLFPGIPIWLSETSSAYGGGAPGLSDTFIAGFLWLDKLGQSARSGIHVVVRQSLFYGHYSLLDTHTLDPLPDWWLSVLYKKLVGTTVLNTEQFLNGSGSLRLYAHCSFNRTDTKRSIITLFGMNLKNSESQFYVENTSSPESAYISAYVLTGYKSLTSRSTCLNGNPLILNPDGTLPALKPTIQSLNSPIYLPPYSLGFWTLHDLNTNVCNMV